MSTAAELALVLRARDSAGPILKKVEKQLAQVDRVASKMGRSFGPMGTALGAGLSGIGALAVTAGLSFNSFQEGAQTAFRTLLGDAGKANAMLAQIEDTAKRTPFDIEGLTRASQRLLGFGVAADQVIPMLTDISDAVSGLGGGVDMVDRLTLAFGQMTAKGRAQTEELNQIAETGIPVWQMLADNIGQISPRLAEARAAGKINDQQLIQQLQKMLATGKLPADKAIAMIRAGMQQRFGGLSKEQSSTTSGAVSNFKDTLNAAFAAFTEGPFKQAAPILIAAAEAVDKMAEGFKRLPAPIQAVIGWLALITTTILAGGVLASITGLGGAFSALMGVLGTVATFIGGAVLAVVGALGLPLTVLIALVAALGLAWATNFLGIRDATSAAVSAVGKIISSGWRAVVDVFEWLGERATEVLGAAWGAVVSGFNWLVATAGAVLSAGWAAIVAAVQNFGNIMSGVLTLYVGAWVLLFQGLANAVGPIVATGWAYVVSLFSWLYSTAAPIVEAMGAYVAGVFSWLVGTVGAGMRTGLEYVVTLFTWLGATVAPIVSGALGNVAGSFSWLISTVSGWIATGWQAVVGWFEWLGSTASNAISLAFGTIAGMFTWLRDTGATAIEWLANRVVQLFTWLGDRVRAIWNPIAELVGRAQAAGSGAIGAAVGAVGGAIGYVNGQQIPHLASGGIAMSPTLAVIGDRPGTGEVVMGLDQLGSYLDAAAGSGGGRTVVLSPNFNNYGTLAGHDVQNWLIGELEKLRKRGVYAFS